ncbi:Hypothetical protein SMAX5B_008721 [Scophthalmus maximus]|uniref:Uncharacterized protein n=1 Tax=Scophthalmus maximus TaxID=52904 RepID=A0A2U9CRL6_SCOMX|nr:Hypothetical protein SMAX5B_008721 [Scophthalmus maximus]
MTRSRWQPMKSVERTEPWVRAAAASRGDQRGEDLDSMGNVSPKLQGLVEAKTVKPLGNRGLR